MVPAASRLRNSEQLFLHSPRRFSAALVFFGVKRTMPSDRVCGDDQVLAGYYDRISQAAEHDPLFKCLLDKKLAHQEFAKVMRDQQRWGGLDNGQIRKLMLSAFQGADLRYNPNVSVETQHSQDATPTVENTSRWGHVKNLIKRHMGTETDISA